MKGGLVRVHQEVRGSLIRVRGGKGGLSGLRYPGRQDYRGCAAEGVKGGLACVNGMKSSVVRPIR
jgi:hypothetical protein